MENIGQNNNEELSPTASPEDVKKVNTYSRDFLVYEEQEKENDNNDIKELEDILQDSPTDSPTEGPTQPTRPTQPTQPSRPTRPTTEPTRAPDLPPRPTWTPIDE